MATGALDANGIWQYGEDDSEATFSALLNKLGASTSTQVGLVKTTGRVIQTVTSFYATTLLTSSTSYVTTNLTATITPKSSTSRIIGFFSAQCYNAPSQRTTLTAFRGTVSGTQLAVGTNGLGAGYSTAENVRSITGILSDLPSTTSAVTYTIGVKTSGGLGSVHDGNSLSTLILMEIAV
jgi:hypothetical protein